jgi:hypothetical protein
MLRAQIYFSADLAKGGYYYAHLSSVCAFGGMILAAYSIGG